jgi:hypothetical protein
MFISKNFFRNASRVPATFCCVEAKRHKIYIMSCKHINGMMVNCRVYFAFNMRVLSQASEHSTPHFYVFKFQFSATIFNCAGIKHWADIVHSLYYHMSVLWSNEKSRIHGLQVRSYRCVISPVDLIERDAANVKTRMFFERWVAGQATTAVLVVVWLRQQQQP